MNGKLTILLFCLLILLGCGRKNPNPCSLSEETLSDLKTEDSLIHIPEIQARDDAWKKNNYGEPSILKAEYDTYRFILSSTWGWTETVRVEKRNNKYLVITKRFDRVIGHLETTVRTEEFEIPETKWKSMENGLHAHGFWTYRSSIDRTGVDGENWLLEAYKHEKDPCTFKNYHGVVRWSPDDTAFIKMCNLMMDLRQH